jgi:hypothetical protein
MKKLPFDEINLVDLGGGKYSIDIVADNGNNDMYSDIDIIQINATKDDTSEIDSLIEILKIYKSKIKLTSGAVVELHSGDVAELKIPSIKEINDVFATPINDIGLNLAFKVSIIESEAGCGRKIDDWMVCLSIEDTQKFEKEFNSKNTSYRTPDWYMQVEGEPKNIYLNDKQYEKLKIDKRVYLSVLSKLK